MFKVFVTSAPISLKGYYPLYTDKKTSDEASPEGSSHEHIIDGKKYYMPNGVPFFHGNYKELKH